MVEVIATGTGERVVFVHGDVFGAEATWATQRPLADNYRLLLMNRRGFGHSPDVEGKDFEVDANDVVEVLGDGAHLVGHSYGVVVALMAAAHRPETIRSLAVFEPPAFALVAERPDVQSFIAEVKAILAADRWRVRGATLGRWKGLPSSFRVCAYCTPATSRTLSALLGSALATELAPFPCRPAAPRAHEGRVTERNVH